MSSLLNQIMFAMNCLEKVRSKQASGESPNLRQKARKEGWGGEAPGEAVGCEIVWCSVNSEVCVSDCWTLICVCDALQLQISHLAVFVIIKRTVCQWGEMCLLTFFHRVRWDQYHSCLFAENEAGARRQLASLKVWKQGGLAHICMPR